MSHDSAGPLECLVHGGLCFLLGFVRDRLATYWQRRGKPTPPRRRHRPRRRAKRR